MPATARFGDPMTVGLDRVPICTAALFIVVYLAVGAGCTQQSVTDCPSIEVSVDGSAAEVPHDGGLSEYPGCAQICAPHYPLCQDLGNGKIRCQAACG